VLPGNEKPDQRQPQLAGVRHRPIVDEDLGRVRGTDNFEQLPQTGGVRRPESRAIAPRSASSSLAKLGRRAREFERSRERGRLEMREDERDRERTRTRAEQCFVEVGIERRELLVGGLLRQIRVRPEALQRPVLRGIG
jgi:hypothetical protein